MQDLSAANVIRATSDNREAVESSGECACYSCVRRYPATEITEYTGGPSECAVCPYCHVDAVLPDYVMTASINDLRGLRRQWFGI